jgi:hypothetical protein
MLFEVLWRIREGPDIWCGKWTHKRIPGPRKREQPKPTPAPTKICLYNPSFEAKHLLARATKGRERNGRVPKEPIRLTKPYPKGR